MNQGAVTKSFSYPLLSEAIVAPVCFQSCLPASSGVLSLDRVNQTESLLKRSRVRRTVSHAKVQISPGVIFL